MLRGIADDKSSVHRGWCCLCLLGSKAIGKQQQTRYVEHGVTLSAQTSPYECYNGQTSHHVYTSALE